MQPFSHPLPQVIPHPLPQVIPHPLPQVIPHPLPQMHQIGLPPLPYIHYQSIQLPQNPNQYIPSIQLPQIGLLQQQNTYPQYQLPQMPWNPLQPLIQQRENITKKEITDLLTQDSYYRKLKQWPLLTSNKILIPNQIRYVDDVFYISSYSIFTNIIDISTISFEINKDFPFINDLLSKFNGHLVACGGAIVKSIFKGNRGDIDLFFYNLSSYEADKMRIDAIEFLVNSWRKDFLNVNFYIKRNEYTTTLYVITEDDDIHEYQFIHRIYPDISSIIGGFDLSICMVAYDGKEIYATPLGAWSIQNNYIIIDTKRRSTSFEHRLQKYKGRTGLIFPGISKQLVDVFSRQSDMRKNMMSKIQAIAKDYGYSYYENWEDFDYIGNVNPECSSYGIQKKEDILPYFRLDASNIGTPSYDRKNIENRLIDKISDYSSLSSHPKYFQDMNAQQLRSDNLRSVCSIFELDVDVRNQLINDIDNPNITLDNSVITKFYDKVNEIKRLFEHKLGYDQYRDFYRLIKCFGKLTSKVIEVRDTDQYYEYRDIMINKMMTNVEICRKNLIGIKWITQNPGRQWTSSINPIIADPRQWYGKHYIPVITGIPPEIETTMRLMRLPKTKSVWTMIDDDVFYMVCLHLLHKYANEAWNYTY